MACSDCVSSRVTDAVTQTNVKVLAEAPAMAMGGLYQSSAAAIGNTLHSSAHALSQYFMTSQAATIQGLAILYGVNTAATAAATTTIDLNSVVSLLALLQAAQGVRR